MMSQNGAAKVPAWGIVQGTEGDKVSHSAVTLGTVAAVSQGQPSLAPIVAAV